MTPTARAGGSRRTARITDPAPAAMPLTAAMTGIGSSRSALTTAPVIRVKIPQLGRLALDELDR